MINLVNLVCIKTYLKERIITHYKVNGEVEGKIEESICDIMYELSLFLSLLYRLRCYMCYYSFLKINSTMKHEMKLPGIINLREYIRYIIMLSTPAFYG